jgi:hypothetical protein
MPSRKIRVGELAKLLGLQHRMMLSFIQSIGIPAKSVSTTLDVKQAERVQRLLVKRNLIEKESEFIAWSNMGLGNIYFDLFDLEVKNNFSIRPEFLEFHQNEFLSPEKLLANSGHYVRSRILFVLAKNSLETDANRILRLALYDSQSDFCDAIMAVVAGFLRAKNYKLAFKTLHSYREKTDFYIPELLTRQESQILLQQTLAYSIRERDFSALAVLLRSKSLSLLDNPKGWKLLASVLQTKGDGWFCSAIFSWLSDHQNDHSGIPDRLLFWAVLDGVSNNDFDNVDFALSKIQDKKLKLLAVYLSSELQRDEVQSSESFTAMIESQCQNIDDVRQIVSRIASTIGRNDLENVIMKSIQAWHQTFGSLPVAVGTVIHQISQKNNLTTFEIIGIIDPTLVPSEIELDLVDDF